MKRRFLYSIILLSLGACKEKQQIPPSQPDLSNKTKTELVAPTENATSVSLYKVSAEQMSSTLSVKIISRALPQKTYTGAMLHPDETSVLSISPKSHCVLALLNGWTEAQLKQPDTRIELIRNLSDISKRSYSPISYRGALLQFEPSSGLALIAYTVRDSSVVSTPTNRSGLAVIANTDRDSVNAKLDGGYKINRNNVPTASLQALRVATRYVPLEASDSPNPSNKKLKLGKR